MHTAICSPSCQNGGKCLSHNVCQCGKEYRGKQCQYNVEVCSPKKIEFNGAYNCSGNNDVLRCSLSCPEGVEFSSQPMSEYVCKYEEGKFLPLPIPQCKYSKRIVIISFFISKKTRINENNCWKYLNFRC